MKKVLFTFVACLMAIVMLSSCGHSNTPTGVAEAAIKCLKSKDYKGYVALTNAPDSQKEQMVALLQKVAEEGEKKGGLKDYEIISEEINEDGDKATVTVKTVYEDGSEDQEKMKLVNEDGKWLLSADK